VFDADHDSTDDLSIALAFGGVLAPDLRPEDLRPVKNFELLGPINLNFMRDVWAFDDGCVVSVARLHKIDAFV
jgi:hypothetical protein